MFMIFFSNLCDNQKILCDNSKIKTIEDLTKIKYKRKTQIKIPCTIKMKRYIKMYEKEHKDLKIKRKELRKNKRKYKKICEELQIKNINLESKTSLKMYKGEKKIQKVLKKLKTQYDLYYFHNYRLNFCKNKINLEYDYLCMLINNGLILLFVIEYDGEQHYGPNKIYDYEETHKRDILKQYYLYNLNINLIRLNKKSEVSKEIKKFIKDMIQKKDYLLKNPIKPNKKICNDKSEHNGIKLFEEHYKKYNGLPDISIENM